MSRAILITLLVLIFSTNSALAKDLPITIKKGMGYIKARSILLKDGWQTVTAHTTPNGTPVCFKVASMYMTDEGYKDAANSASCKFEEIDACSGSGMGFCSMSFFDGNETYLSITTANGEPPNANIYSWKKYKEKDFLSRQPSKTSNLQSSESTISASFINKIDAINLLSKKIESDADYRNNPAQKKLAICVFDLALDEVFSDLTMIDSTTLESRLKSAIDHMKANQDPKMLNCVSNYNALDQDRQMPLTDMDDLRSDFTSFNGRKVRIQAVGNYVMNIFMLKKNSSDMSPIVVDISKLQLDQRRKILQQCADIMNGCRVTVYGTIGKVSYQNGIYAEKVEW